MTLDCFICGTLADLLIDATADTSTSNIFSAFGLGILDVAVGRWVYHTAVAAGDSVEGR